MASGKINLPYIPGVVVHFSSSPSLFQRNIDSMLVKLLFLVSLFVFHCAHGSFIGMDLNNNVVLQSDSEKIVTINGIDVLQKMDVLNTTLGSLQSFSIQQNQIISEQSQTISQLQEKANIQNSALAQQFMNISAQNKVISEQSQTISQLQEKAGMQDASLTQQVHYISELNNTIALLQEALILQHSSIASLQEQVLLLNAAIVITKSAVEQLAAGYYQTCALMITTGGMRCWGYNNYGQLGDGTTNDLYSPPSSDVLSGVAQISAGYYHICALMSGTGGVRCWGYNNYGQLGDGTTNDLYTPPSSDVLSGVSQIVTGIFHTCALMSGTGGVRCWGYNNDGELGDGTSNAGYSPPDVDVLEGVSQIASGFKHTCVLMSSTGGVRCWGWNQYGQLGDGTTNNVLSPPSSDVLTGVVQIATGDSHTCALMSGTGGVRCWGYNGDGELGDGSTSDLWYPPSSDILTGVAQIAAGAYHTCALMSGTGGVRCWGYNNNGELGVGDTNALYSPLSNNVLTGVARITTGWYHTCATMSGTNEIRCWGDNSHGELGVGSTSNVLSPPGSDLVFH